MQLKHKLVGGCGVTLLVQPIASEWSTAPTRAHHWHPILLFKTREKTQAIGLPMFQVKEKSLVISNPFVILPSSWTLSMACFPRLQEIGQQSQIQVYYFRNKHNGQKDWTSHVSVPHLLILGSRAQEPQLLKSGSPRAHLHSKRSHCSEKPTHHK